MGVEGTDRMQANVSGERPQEFRLTGEGSTRMVPVGVMAPWGLSASSQTLKRMVPGFRKQRLTDCNGAIVTVS